MTAQSPSKEQIYGLNHSLLVEESGVLMHAEVVGPWRELVSAAARAGFDLAIVSSFRDFERQFAIWSAKARGERELLDDSGRPLPASIRENGWATVQAILRWSALPGASRHHWGCDFDVIDRAALPEGYRVQLVPSEVDEGGIFAPLHCWLDQYLQTDQAPKFFRPYAVDSGGVAVERWHLSYAPVALQYQRGFAMEGLLEILRQRELPLIDVIAEHAGEIETRFVRVAADCYPESCRDQIRSFS